MFWERPKFVKEDLILERKQQATRKQHAKIGKSSCKRKRNVACRQEGLTMTGLGFLIGIVMTINHKIV